MRFAVGEQVTFAEEPTTPYTVRAIGKRFAILTRPHTNEDRDEFEIDDDEKDEPVRTIVDRELWVRGDHDRVFNFWDFKSDEDIAGLLSDLESGDVAVSRRSGIPVVLSDPIHQPQDRVKD